MKSSVTPYHAVPCHASCSLHCHEILCHLDPIPLSRSSMSHFYFITLSRKPPIALSRSPFDFIALTRNLSSRSDLVTQLCVTLMLCFHCRATASVGEALWGSKACRFYHGVTKSSVTLRPCHTTVRHTHALFPLQGHCFGGGGVVGIGSVSFLYADVTTLTLGKVGRMLNLRTRFPPPLEESGFPNGARVSGNRSQVTVHAPYSTSRVPVVTAHGPCTFDSSRP